MKLECTEQQFRIAVNNLFPNYIFYGRNAYWLDAHKLLVGKYRISYWNPYLDSDDRMVFDSIDDTAVDCIKFMCDLFLKRAVFKVISKEKYVEFNSKLKSNKIEVER
jgi:hypothetical protein